MITSDVENYPGYPDGVLGPEMMQDFRRQAERFGAEFLTDDVTQRRLLRAALPRLGRRRRVPRRDGDRRHRRDARASSGSSPSARCRAAASPTARPATAPSSGTRSVVVVGGGDSAMEEALFLTKFATQGDDRAPPRRVPRLADHARPRAREREDRVRDDTPSSRRCSAARTGKMSGVRLRDTRDGRDARARARRASSSRSGTTRTRRSSSTSSTTTTRATSSRSPARPRRTSRASSPRATCRTTSTGRRSPPPARAAWPRSTPSASSPPAEGARARRSRAAAGSGGGLAERVATLACGWPRATAGSTCSTRAGTSSQARLPAEVHDRALEQLLAPAQHEDEPRPKLEAHGDYVFGVFLVPVAAHGGGRALLPGGRPRHDARRGRHRAEDARRRARSVRSGARAGGLPR